ncbi:hypothetical protein Dda_6906 [Drechslerella dactyloides]|uniref:Uncharacterized protein n=1 Tax=Drechslerella dactyloides TaxID=74499 RepID=A0AAD6NH27_DREDA|nr:hypothetical protein Dda_6906 [Drechslerella dactyloides]
MIQMYQRCTNPAQLFDNDDREYDEQSGSINSEARLTESLWAEERRTPLKKDDAVELERSHHLEAVEIVQRYLFTKGALDNFLAAVRIRPNPVLHGQKCKAVLQTNRLGYRIWPLNQAEFALINLFRTALKGSTYPFEDLCRAFDYARQEQVTGE